MRIGILTHSAMSAYYFRLALIKALIKNNHEIIIITPKDEFSLELAKQGFNVCHYELSRASVNPLVVLKNLLSLKNTLKNLNLDLLQTSAHKSNTTGIIAAKLAGIKYTFGLVEGLGSFYIDEDFKSKLVKTSINFLYKIVFKLANGFIFVNESNALFMKNLGLKDEKIKIIKSVGVNLKQFLPLQISKEEREYFLQEFNMPNKPIVLMIARALWHKGIKEFYEAANLLKDQANFVLVGGRDDNKSCAPLEFLNSGNVFYLGARKDIARLLNLCDIFVLPSYKEGYPRTVLEAMACKKACVVSDCEGCIEAVENAIDGLICKSKDAKDLVEKIQILLEDEKFKNTLAKNAFIKAQNYNENHIALEYIEFYKGFVDV
ncbi:N,N'-diacetylbacillosaminyl-diphospho-undecaprenol alpha-1,3-N-acetylgalactosaminyltransferase [Campylobacter volucris]|uniref:N, N'-diacetylbacillosaminyl-diphospho-undecaprenol alpha-1,3-N-acetylgalactosaminyltransferase n=1 Tax=Campylobacter volucris TaxID=1031542 RepID=A0AAE5YH09_9BACT|nr:N,N'-diacetylbacillosaminyl-diphospho-undecaprenol alpha-1,3-N-acetylgalactosaminyltransferase [Campylobacter volucris]AJC94532.1 N,N'-diacetylbacillosaminyl-diphospho-undecaprenol alpha-1,3-N-acetylgalactosaminyltransferase [Campylobacter volucris LMG 24379]KAB0578156.1 N,N'-diacetylbacillosaminyl-diphospho-undecaprenol alpha-1,3-N-acetylgalactosaminyltransferase [Campylobacter volucris]QBL13116.1 N,N'-diacetylbacillosaminyl-diphospho-undecaprenol alpha-1,3-N-acetylgalactosaminyltransferase 